MRLTSRPTSNGLAGILVAAVAWLAASAVAVGESTTLTIRGRQQTVHLFGPPKGDPVIVSSGDGGWIHLGPHVAEFLAARGFYVIGFDVKVYLSSFTSERSTLRPEDEPADYRTLTGLAQKATEIGRASCRERA